MAKTLTSLQGIVVQELTIVTPVSADNISSDSIGQSTSFVFYSSSLKVVKCPDLGISRLITDKVVLVSIKLVPKQFFSSPF